MFHLPCFGLDGKIRTRVVLPLASLKTHSSIYLGHLIGDMPNMNAQVLVILA